MRPWASAQSTLKLSATLTIEKTDDKAGQTRVDARDAFSRHFKSVVGVRFLIPEMVSGSCHLICEGQTTSQTDH